MPERREAILRYPLEQQVDLYLAATFKTHPPDTGLTVAIASNGAAVVPALLDRITRDDRDAAKDQLLVVFWYMQGFGYYSVTSDGRAMEVLERQVTMLEGGPWEVTAVNMFEKIRAGNGQTGGDRETGGASGADGH